MILAVNRRDLALRIAFQSEANLNALDSIGGPHSADMSIRFVWFDAGAKIVRVGRSRRERDQGY
jgi:hypothetical protein